MPILAATLVLAITGGAANPPQAVRVAPSPRLVAAERDACVATCPAIPAGATSDWLRSPEGQSANGCQLACRTDQPAADLYHELAQLAVNGQLKAEIPMVKLAGKDGPELSRKLQAALRDADGRRLGPLCTRARDGHGGREELAFLECIGRVLVKAEAKAALPQPDETRALRCALQLAERELDWLARCPTLEARADVESCVVRAPDGSRRTATAENRAGCERDAVEWLAGAFRIKRP